ncbi:MAG: co-chaperone GroES [Bdellovibrionales bacterium]|nr:co-chaperone GroES [Bdellovibrionales bacterium]
MTPLDDRIVIQREIESGKTAGGLFIPNSALEQRPEGRVVLVGRGHKDKKGRLLPLDVQVGDFVITHSYAGTEAELNGTSVLIVRESDILGVVSK